MYEKKKKFSGRKIARNVMAMAAGESSIMATATGVPTVEISATELPEIVKTIQEAVRFYFGPCSLLLHFFLS